MSSGRKYFVDTYKQSLQVNEHLLRDNSVRRAGFAKVEILKTPMGHRVVIHAIRLGMVIGKAGRNIKRLTDELETLYGLESPQLEVKELENPDLVARVQADKLLSQIERGFHFRRAAHSLIRRIMASGARGVEILISGKLSSQRARREAFREGFVAKAGNPAQEYVDEAVAHSIMKQGIIGIKVRIMSPKANLPDEPIFYETPFEEEGELLEEIRSEEPIVEKIEESPIVEEGELDELSSSEDVDDEEEDEEEVEDE